MKTPLLLLFVCSLLLTGQAQASNSYMSGSPTLIQQALEDIYGIGAGVGLKNGQCLLCHNSEAGGSGNLNSSFGMDFQTAALAEGYGTGGGNRTRTQLAIIFDNLEFAQKDSDNDGILNGEEFERNTDPSENFSGASPFGTSGAGCGRTTPPTKPSGGLWLFVLLPLFLILRLKKRLTTR